VLQDNLPEETCADWKERAVQVLNTASPNVQDVQQWADCEQWLPHAQLCATWIEQEHLTIAEAAHLLDRAGSYLNDRARYSEAEPLLQSALTIQKERWDIEHPDTALSLNNLGLLYERQARYTEAEVLLKQALEIAEEQLGSNHPHTSTGLNNLAAL